MAATYAQRDYPPIPEIRTIGVIGAGQMGAGIAQVAAQAGYEVRLSDVSRPALEGATSRIDYFLGRQVKKEVLSETERREALARINDLPFDSSTRRTDGGAPEDGQPCTPRVL